MLGLKGLQHLAHFIHYLERAAGITELTLNSHAILPMRWCITHTNGRVLQIAVVLDDEALEIDYIVDGGCTKYAVYDDSNAAERVLAWFRGETEKI